MGIFNIFYHSLIFAGKEKLASMPSGGGAVSASAGAAAPAAAAEEGKKGKCSLFFIFTIFVTSDSPCSGRKLSENDWNVYH
jgi:hypothetical protein